MIYDDNDDDDDDDDEGLILPSFLFGMILLFFRFLLLSLEIVLAPHEEFVVDAVAIVGGQC